MSDRLVKCLATFFYVGNLPLAPGSMASLAGVVLWVFFRPYPSANLALIFIVTLTGFIVSGRMETIMRRKDPGCIVIDEVAGVLIAFYLLPLTPAVVATGFLLFRAFDMFKIYPADRFEPLPGGVGVMMDDIIAGIYTNITLQIALRLAGIV